MTHIDSSRKSFCCSMFLQVRNSYGKQSLPPCNPDYSKRSATVEQPLNYVVARVFEVHDPKHSPELLNALKRHLVLCQPALVEDEMVQNAFSQITSFNAGSTLEISTVKALFGRDNLNVAKRIGKSSVHVNEVDLKTISIQQVESWSWTTELQ